MEATCLMLRFFHLPTVLSVQKLQLLKLCLDTLFRIWIEISSLKLQIAKNYGTLKQRYLRYISDF